ncbi:hypothetical protein BIU97_07650 [Curtobacterium sp. MCBA15_009]|nr:hypothetical protein BIU97_07650 [Curtobacterium sp. MCBA15_009]OII30361.1 hypothetical protein BIU94_06155 [Curtobacterium sp. MMLR14_006]
MVRVEGRGSGAVPHATGALRRVFGSAWFIGLLATLATAVGSGVPSYWNDEAATLRLARLPVADMLAFVQEKDAVHVVYALLVHGWIAVFGESEVAVRAPSAIAVGVATAGVVVLVRELGQPRAAVVAAVVFVVLPRTSFNGTEARSYALTTALVTWAAVWALRAGRNRGAGRWTVFAVLTGLAAATFVYALLLVPAFVALALLHGRVDRRRLVALAVAVAAAVVIAAPVLVTAASQGSQVGWLAHQPVNAWTVLVEPFAEQAWWLAALLTTIVVVVGARRARRPWVAHRRTVLALALWLLLPGAVLVLGSLLVTPVYTPRYLSMSTPAAAVVVGLAVAGVRRTVAWVLLAAVVLAAAPALVTMRTPLGKPAGTDLRGIARTLQHEARPGDGFLLADGGTVSLRPRVALAAYPDAFAGLDDVAYRGSYRTTGSYSDRLVGTAALRDRLRSEQRVWLVVPDAGDRELRDALRATGFAPAHREHVAGAEITLWTR